jgi:hypothetical protein
MGDMLITFALTKTRDPRELFDVLDEDANPYDAHILSLEDTDAFAFDLLCESGGGVRVQRQLYDGTFVLATATGTLDESSFTPGEVFFKDTQPSYARKT